MLVPIPSVEAVRQIARQEAEAARQGGPGLRILGPQGEIDAPLALAIPAPGVLTAPAGAYMTAANCLARDFYAEEFAAYCASVGQSPLLHRRMWEYAFVAHHLAASGRRGAGATGLAISAPDDPLPALFAADGGKIEHVGAMSELPTGWRYDFLWSVGATLRGPRSQAVQEAVDLVERRLNDGGVAVFTDELNIRAYARNADDAGPFARADVEALREVLLRRGHSVAPLPFELSLTLLDSLVDLPPFSSGVNLKALKGGAVVSSFGMVVVRRRRS